MSNLTPSASWDAVIQLEGTMAGVPATWNTPNQSLLNRTEWLKSYGVFKDANGNVGIGGPPTALDRLAVFGRAYVSTTTPENVAAFFQNLSPTGFGLRVDGGVPGRYCLSVRDYAGNEFFQVDGAGNCMSVGGKPIGYGAGSGGAVTQATSKSTAVTINKPSGQITMNAAALAAGASVSFQINNSVIGDYDVLVPNAMVTAIDPRGKYRIEVDASGAGFAAIRVTNISGGSLSEAVAFKFVVIKGSTT